MQMKRIVFIALLFLGIYSAKSQVFINEISYTGTTGYLGANDGWVQPSDWIELYNDGNLALSLNNYCLTNDRNNLFKWKFPMGLSIPSGSFYVVRCSGRNMPDKLTPTLLHTNFDLQQCKDQWLLLTYQGVIKDSLFIRHTKKGDWRGRYPFATIGNLDWKLFSGAIPTYSAANAPTIPAGNVYIDYAPTPTFSLQAGWKLPADGLIHIWNPDTVHFQVNYTMTDCSYINALIPCTLQDLSLAACTTPVLTYSIDNTGLLPDPSDPGVTTVFRAICVPKLLNTNPSFSLSYSSQFLPSFVETNTYFRGTETTINNGFGVISVCINPTFSTTATTQTIHVEYFDKYKFYSEGYANAAKPVNDPWPNQQRGFNVGLNDYSGFGCELQGQVFNDATLGVSTRTAFPQFAVKAAGVDNFSNLNPVAAATNPGTHLRDAFVQTYAMTNGINLDGLHYKPVIGVINGCYQGIWEFRELADYEYTKYYYGHGKDSVDILEQYIANVPMGNGNSNGVDTGWVAPPVLTNTLNGTFNYIQHFAPTFNTVGQPFFNQVMKKIDQKNFMDFMIYNSFLVNADLMGLNDSWWRGITPVGGITNKWRWFMWDMNNVLHLNPLSVTSNMNVSPCFYTANTSNTTIPTMTTTAAAYIAPGFMEWAFERDGNYHSDYLTRYMDLLNTTLRCDKMLAHFQYFRNMFTPEMVNHTTYWATTTTEWDANMDSLKSSLTIRCNKINKLLASAACHKLQGPYNITVDVRPVGAGYVDLNSLHLTNFTWSGIYYNDTPVLTTTLQAAPFDTSAYVFDHWEFSYHTPSPSLKSNSVTFVLVNNESLVAVFSDKRNDIVVPTGFTPNGDGQNDLLSPLGAAARYARDYEFQIWNRWGQEVYRTSDPLTGWDGNYNGTQAQTGVYAYVIKYKNVLNENKMVKGNVTLIR